jgi:uncharacterized Zn-finger protein
MAAMVAQQQHHQNMWPQPQRHQNMLPMTSMHPASSAPATSRSYQPNHVELPVSFIGQGNMPHQMPFQTTGYGYDLTSMNHQYPVQPPQAQYAINFSQPPVPQPPASYPTANDSPAPLTMVRDARNAIPSVVARSPSVKTEIQSPIHPLNHLSVSPNEPLPAASFESVETTSATFSTDVDQLMKIVQKSTGDTSMEIIKKPSPGIISAANTNKTRKRYQCDIPGCHKSFFQKTHLEIHTRAHTGVKPFLCKEPGCGQRFSQLGNLKVNESTITAKHANVADP